MVEGHPDLHLQAGRRQVNPKDKDMLDFSQGCLQMNIGFIYTLGNDEARICIDMTDRGGFRYHSSQLCTRFILGIRNVIRTGRKFLTGK